MTDRQQPPAGQFRKVQRRMCDEFELRLRKTVVVDRVVFERSVRPRRKRQVDRVQHQQPDLLCREVDVKTVADTGRRDGSGREAVRIDEALPLRAAEAVRCIGLFGLAVIGVVIVVAEREPDRQPAGAHRFGGERDFTLRLLSRPVAVAHVARIDQECGTALPPCRGEVPHMGEGVRAVAAKVAVLFEVRIGDETEQKIVCSGVFPDVPTELFHENQASFPPLWARVASSWNRITGSLTLAFPFRVSM